MRGHSEVRSFPYMKLVSPKGRLGLLECLERGAEFPSAHLLMKRQLQNIRRQDKIEGLTDGVLRVQILQNASRP